MNEEFQPVTLENYEFKNRQNNKSNGIFWHFWPISTPMFGQKSETIQPKKSSASIKLSESPAIETLLEELKAVVFKKDAYTFVHPYTFVHRILNLKLARSRTNFSELQS